MSDAGSEGSEATLVGSANGSRHVNPQPDESTTGSDVDEETLEEENIEEPQWSLSCEETCKPHWLYVKGRFIYYRDLYFQYHSENVRLRREINRLLRENRDARELIQKLRGLTRVKTVPTWKEHLVVRIEGESALDDEEASVWSDEAVQPMDRWGDVVKLSNQDNNMSAHPEKLHPNLNLGFPTPEEEQSLVEQEMNPEVTLSDLHSVITNHPGEGSPIAMLPASILVRILRLVLVFDGRSVHAISRLDPYREPTVVPRNINGRVTLLHRFHVGTRKVNLSMATKPQVLLAPLAVCKEWNYIGAHLFYSQNRFCFSSLGDPRGKSTSRRTLPLMWLGEAKWLKTITFHVNESAKSYMRRPNEPGGIINHMKQKTKDQPNFRGFRSLRNLQGLDYIHMLRGLEKVDFMDYDKWIQCRQKCMVRDWTFSMDLNNVISREKSDAEAESSLLTHLSKLVNDYNPSREVLDAVELAVRRVRRETAVPAMADPGNVPLGPAPIVIEDEDECENESEIEDDNEEDEEDGDDGDDGDDDGGDGGDGDGEGDDHDDEDEDDEDDDMDNGGDEATQGPSQPTPEGPSGGGAGDAGAEFDEDEDEYDPMNIVFEFEEDNNRFGSQPAQDTPSPGSEVVDLTSDDPPDESDARSQHSTPIGADPSQVYDPESVSRRRSESSLSVSDDANSYSGGSRSPPGDRDCPLEIPDDDGPGPQPGGRSDSSGSSVGRPSSSTEGSLFLRSPSRATGTEFRTKLETPDPQPLRPLGGVAGVRGETARYSSSPFSTPNREQFTTPSRQIREESSLFMSPTRYRSLVPPSTSPEYNPEQPYTQPSTMPEDPSDSTGRGSARKRSQDRQSPGGEGSGSGDDGERDGGSPPKRART